MKTFEQDDERLRSALRECQVNTPLPPRFQEQVWRRIARAETEDKGATWSGSLRWLDRVLARPALAGACLVMLLTVGSGAGYWQVSHEAAQLDQVLALRYVQAVDPYQTPRY